MGDVLWIFHYFLIKDTQLPNVVGLPGTVFAAVVNDHRILPYPVQIVAGIFGIGVVDVQNAVAEVIFLGVGQKDFVAVEDG